MKVMEYTQKCAWCGAEGEGYARWKIAGEIYFACEACEEMLEDGGANEDHPPEKPQEA